MENFKTLVIPILIIGMLVTGCSNSLLTKFQDQQCVDNCESADPHEKKYFEQPVIQSLQMFLAEAACFSFIALHLFIKRVKLVYKKYKNNNNNNSIINNNNIENSSLLYSNIDETPNDEDAESDDGILTVPLLTSETRHTAISEVPELEGKNILWMAIPAFCDIIGTTVMQTGLLFIPVSIYQMTRGALVLFVGIFSVLFLKRKLFAYQWFALFIVLTGVFIVGLSNALSSVDDTPSRYTLGQGIIGVSLVAFGQIATATQFVTEEHILENYALEPIHAVAYEGIFGTFLTIFLISITYPTIGLKSRKNYLNGKPTGYGSYFDIVTGFNELFSSSNLIISSIAIMVSIAAFNFFGLSVTRTVSASTRSQIDTCRTIGIWLVSLILGWESFKYLQLVGFILLVYGTLLFNGVVEKRILWFYVHKDNPDLLQEEPVEHI